MRHFIPRRIPLTNIFALLLLFFTIAPASASITPKEPAVPAPAAAAAPVAAPTGLSPTAQDRFLYQVGLLDAEKKALTPIQRKINATIVRVLHTEVLKDKKRSLPGLADDLKMSESNVILVDITADVTDALLEAIKAQGGTIVNSFPQYRAIRARIPITAVEAIAALPGVQFIDKAHERILQKQTTSEGDIAHNAPLVRSAGYTGTGVKIGVISDSVDYLAQLQATGDLPANVTVLQDDPGQSGEGTAMLEIVYDLAPNASLYFATADGGKAAFANNIIALKNAGCSVIVDDVGYFSESPFQDDVISQAVTTVTGAGAFYFSSAANDGNLHSDHSGTYEGDYKDYVGPNNYHWHDFDTNVIKNTITSSPMVITLQWSDPLGASSNDYDLILYDSNGNIFRESTNYQTGTQDPYEQISIGSDTDITGYSLAILKYSGEARFLHLSASRGTLTYATNGATKGHATVDTAFGVAAVSAHGRTTPFTGSEAVEYYSSDGPRRIFYAADGSAITPGNVSATGGRLRNKPDITAADCVTTSWPGHSYFCGTSAAAPHAAAITGLLLSAKSDATYTDIFNALTTTALPAPATWLDYSGAGIIMANLAYDALQTGSTGSLRVTLGPAEAVTAGAQWNVDGGAWRDSDATATGLTAGSHTVAFKAVTGWTAPASQTVTVSTGQTASVSATYTQGVQTGTIAITITPQEALDAGAKFCIDVSGNTVCGSGTLTTTTGTYSGWFTDVSGWVTPSPTSVTVSAGQTTTVTGAYTVQSPPGSLTVTILPTEAAAAGAQWRLDGGDWHNTGLTLTDVAVGNHTVSFKPVSGWRTPDSQTATITSNATTSVQGVYTPYKPVVAPSALLLLLTQ